MVDLTFYGAAGGVTGSKHMIDANGVRILLDCGVFQGMSDVKERNRGFPFPPDSVDAVVLSHAHLDHCGMIPLLVKRGFTGKIFATPATKDVVQHMLEDAASIELQDAEYRRKHHIGAPDEREPLFVREDVAAAISRVEEVPYARQSGQWHPITRNARLKFYDAGHILGSAVSVLEITTDNSTVHIAYTGDLGPQHTPLLRDPEVPEERSISTLLLESTYGSRIHEPLQKAMDRLASTIRRVCERGGKIIIPAFSLGRTQVLVYVIHKLVDEGAIPRIPMYVDSPLATNITDIYRRHARDYDEQSELDFGGTDHRPLAFENLTYTRSVAESKALNQKEGPFLIIAASGMMTAGRVVHHLRHNISDSRNAVFITGYQAEGTSGRQLLEGARKIELYGDWFDVKAEIALFNEFSAHADAQELQAYAESMQGLKNVFLVHGEPHQADDLQTQLERAHPAWNITRPIEGQSFRIA